jgi:spore coat polysaccharide biosynthesis protein SpsF (cytidylyltransferase family)
MKTGILIQARMSSSRLPKKMMMNIEKYKLIEFVYKRCLLSNMSDISAVITSKDKSDDELYHFCIEKNIPVYRGDLNNVLYRYISAADYFGIDTVVRVCGDSPFVDVESIDTMIRMHIDENLEYMCFDKETIIPGLDSEIIKKETLRSLLKCQLSRDDKEHVTLFIKNNLYKYKYKIIKSVFTPKEVKKIRFTVDYKKDLELCRVFYKKYFKCINFNMHDVIKAIREEFPCAE